MLVLLLGAAVLVGAALLGRGLVARDWSVDLDTQRRLQITTGTAVGALVMTQAIAPAPWWALGAAAIAGWSPVRVCQVPRVADWLRNQFANTARARSTGWLVVAAAALFGPWLVAPGRRPLLVARIGIALGAVLLVVHNGPRHDVSAANPHGQTDTIGDKPCSDNRHTERTASDR